MPSPLLPFAALLIAVLAGGCVAPGTTPSPMVCPSTPPGCAKDDVPWYRQDVTAMIPPPPVEPRRPPEDIAATATTDDAAAAPVDPPLPADVDAAAPGPVVSSFAVTRDRGPANEPAAPADPPRPSVASTRGESPASAKPPTESAPTSGRSEQVMQLVRLPSDNLFDLGSAVLGNGGRRSLDALADRLHGTGYTRIHVIAHTDRTGQPMTNLKLSWQRARNVRDHLATRGIPGEILDHEGRGSRDARIDPDRCGRQKAARIRCLAPDRRVDIVVTQRKAP